jgi:hypothetical protein
MVTRIFAPGLMFILLLGVQATFLPETARAATCCPCYNPCKLGCVCRGTVDHCPSCRAGGDLFQAHVKAIISASDFSSGYEPLAITLPTTGLSYGIVALVREGNRRIGNLTSRLLPSAEFSIKAWCPGPLDKSI